jgi:hypothetical protein
MSFAMSVSERAMYAHLLVDNLLQMPADQCKATVDSLQNIVNDPLKECHVDVNILVLWDGATIKDGAFDKVAARRLIEQIQHICNE